MTRLPSSLNASPYDAEREAIFESIKDYQKKILNLASRLENAINTHKL